MTEPIRISNSEIQTWKDCRRKWWLAYYRRLQPKNKQFTGALALGSRIHQALDDHYTKGIPLIEAHGLLVDADKKILNDEYRDTYELDAEAELGRIMLEGYLQWNEENGIDSEFELISAEEVIELPMLEGKVILQGKIDQRVRRKADGVRFFRDWKTVGGSFVDFASGAQMNEQIKTYMLLETAQNKEGERTEGGIFTLFKKVKRTANAKPPFYDQIEVRHNVFTLRAFWANINAVLNDIMGARKQLDEGTHFQSVVYPRPSRDCKWKCQFFALCPMFDDGSAVEQALSDSYEVADPYAYYQLEEKKGSE